MRLFLFLFVFLVLTFLPTLVSAQPAKISREQYFSQLDTATERTEDTFPRKVLQKREEFSNGKSSDLKAETFEYATGNQNRHIIQIDSNGRSTTYQYIQVGKTYFCKENASRWKKSRTSCEPVIMTARARAETEDYTVDTVTSNGKVVKIFRMYETWTYDRAKWSREQIFTVDSKGKLLMFEVNENKVEPKESVSTQVETYEYNIPTPEIRAPIK